MLKMFAPPPPISQLPKKDIEGTYKKFRLKQFISIYAGYAAYYLVRKNMSLAYPYFKSEYGFSTADIGFIGSGLGIAYGLSKFIMGNFSDRSNARYFLATGLILSAIVNVMFGLTQSVGMLFVLMLLNGWFQGMGWPPCGRIMAHWYSNKERGSVMAVWNTAHNVGAALIVPIATVLINAFSSWKLGIFYAPAFLCVSMAAMILLFARDTPQSVGLPPIEEYKNDYPDDIDRTKIAESERELSAKEILFNHVLNNKYVWFIALANIFVYLVRYGVMDWIPLYLQEVKGYSHESARIPFFLFETAAIPGTIFIGWLSDKIFKGRRAPVGILCMIGVVGALFVYSTSDSTLLINVSVSLIGALIYGPVMLIGVAAIDFVPKKAAGTSAGFTGLFGYLGGSVLSSFAIGKIVDAYGWGAALNFMMVASVLAIFFLSFTWNSDTNSVRKSKKSA